MDKIKLICCHFNFNDNDFSTKLKNIVFRALIGWNQHSYFYTDCGVEGYMFEASQYPNYFL
jgi:hypothetical protein